MKRPAVDEFDAGLDEHDNIQASSSDESFDLESHPITSASQVEENKKKKQEKPVMSNGGRLKSTLFVRNLPFGCENQQLEDFFSQMGPLRSAFVIKKKSKVVEGENGEQSAGQEADMDKTSKGFGFVQFAIAEDAEKAIEALKTTKFQGRRLQAELALRKHVHLDASLLKQGQEKKPNDQPVKKAWPKASGPTRCLLLHLNAEHKDITKKILYKRVRKAGPLLELTYPLEGDNRVAKLLFEKVPFAHKALRRLDGHVFKGHAIRVNFFPMDKTDEVKEKEVVMSKSLRAHRLIIRNLPFAAKEEQVREAFQVHGQLDEVMLPRKPDGKAKGFAFVQYRDAADAAMAMQKLNATELAGRLIAVDWALGKKQYEQLKAQDQPTTVESKEVADAEEALESDVDVEGLNSEDEEGVENDEEEIEVVATTERADAKEGTVVFIRNLSFETSQEALQSYLEQSWGPVHYCRLVRMKETGVSRGTAFASFKDAASAQRLCEASRVVQQDDLEDQSGLEDLKRKRTGRNFVSLLEQENSTSGVVLDGRALLVVPAVNRDEAKTLQQKGDKLIPAHDQRCLALIDEALIPEGSKFWPKTEISAREQAVQARRKELKRNPNLLVSPIRLIIRYLPAAVQEADLKKFMLEAHRLATPMADRLLADQPSLLSAKEPARLRQVKIVRGEGDKSRGYAFCQWSHARHALLTVRYLTRQQPNLWHKQLAEAFSQRNNPHARIVPMVEFATEKRSVLARHQERMTEQKQQAQVVAKQKPGKANAKASGSKATPKSKTPTPKPKAAVKAKSSSKSEMVIPAGGVKRRRYRK